MVRELNPEIMFDFNSLFFILLLNSDKISFISSSVNIDISSSLFLI